MLKVNLADEEKNKKDENGGASGEDLNNAGKPHEETVQPEDLTELDQVLSDEEETVELDEIIIDEETVLPTEEISEDDLLGRPLGDDVAEDKTKVGESLSFDDDTTISLESAMADDQTGQDPKPSFGDESTDSIAPQVPAATLTEEGAAEPDSEPAVPAKPISTVEDDYYESDYDVGSGKKKWIFIGGGLIIVLLAVIYFVFDPFGGPSGDVSEVPKIDPVKEAMLAKKKADAQLMSEIRGVYGGQISLATNFVNQIPKSAKLSMLYIYGQDIEIQIFSKDRTAFAEMRNNLKTAKIFDVYQLKDTRTLIPNADVLTTYTVASQPTNVLPPDSAIFFDSGQISRQLETFAGRENLKLKAQASPASASISPKFRTSRIAFTIKGQGKNIINFLNSIKSAPMNVNIAKLSIAGISKNNVNKREMTGFLELNLVMPK